MLTPEQTKLRAYDNEMRELRAENERLKIKVNDMRRVVKEIALEYAKQLPYSQKIKLIEMINEIDV